jgi:hypothetical protein
VVRALADCGLRRSDFAADEAAGTYLQKVKDSLEQDAALHINTVRASHIIPITMQLSKTPKYIFATAIVATFYGVLWHMIPWDFVQSTILFDWADVPFLLAIRIMCISVFVGWSAGKMTMALVRGFEWFSARKRNTE